MPGARTNSRAGRGPRGGHSFFLETHGHQSGPRRFGGFARAERQSDVGMSRQCGDDRQFRVGQGMEAIEPDGPYVQALGGDARGGQFQTAGARGQAPALQFPVHFPIDRQEGGGQRRIRKMRGQAGAVAPGRRELGGKPG